MDELMSIKYRAVVVIAARCTVMVDDVMIVYVSAVTANGHHQAELM